MSDASTDDPGKPMKQPDNDLSQAMEQLPVTTDNRRKNSPSFSDMPIDIVALITEKLDYKQQLILRKVSKSLRALVDKLQPACKSIQIECCMENVTLIFDDQRVMYTKEIYDYENRDDYGIAVLKDNFKKVAFDDLASTLKNRKLRLEKFCTSGHAFENKDIEEYYNEIHRVLESLNHQLSVKKVNLHVLSPSNLLSILSCLKPGFLENISIWFPEETRDINWTIDSTEMNQVALLAQWRQAEELELLDCFDRFPLEYATHFKRFRIYEDNVDGDNFIRIKDFLFKLDNFEQCILSSWMFFVFPDSIYELLGEPVYSNTTEEVFHYSIPDSDYYLEFEKAPGSKFELEIVKKKRESK